jgi:ATP-dependent Clp protease ATP-binding subunit ClpA
VLFDEIEKAAASLSRLLLGVLDKAALRLGDNTTVNFERSLIFLTSNLGARGMNREMRPSFGFDALRERQTGGELAEKLQRVALSAVKKRFSPEFVNRIDVISTYLPLDAEALEEILDHQLADFQRHVNTRLGHRAFYLQVSRQAREFLIRRGTSQEFGARELKRTIHRFVIQPVSSLVARNQVPALSLLQADYRRNDTELTFRCLANEQVA